MDLEQLELLRLSAIEEVKKYADLYLSDNGLTGKLFLNHIIFRLDGKVTFQFSDIQPFEITSSIE